MLVGIFFGGFRSPSPAPGLSRHSPQDDGGCDRFNRFMLVGVFFGGFRSPQAPGARRGRERDIYGGMRVAVVKNASKYFCKSPRFSAERFAKNFAAACRIRGKTIASCLRNVLPQPPSLLPVARVSV